MSESLSPESWNEIGALLVQVLELPPHERDDFLNEACKTRPDFRAEVESLMEAYEEAPHYLSSLGSGILPSALEGVEGLSLTSKSDPHQLLGQQIGHYQVLEMLGSGGMGVVYKAEDTRLKRTVALKFLPPNLVENEKAKQRFLKEAQAASGLDHPNICTIYEVGQSPDGHLFIAMAYYMGETLSRRMARGLMPIEEALDLTVQLARGLAKAHAQGIVHRDIKPANIMVTEDNVVKILDFGLAKLSGGTQLTRTGATMGTAAYMAPEQAQGGEVDHRADIWALGVVLYELLAGQRPFHGDYAPAVLYAVVNQDPQPITGLRDGLPMQLGLLINKALAKPVHTRYQHMTDLLEDLQALHERKVARNMAEATVLPAPAVPIVPEPVLDEDGPVAILVVDDEPELELLIRQKFRKQIRGNEWNFIFASDGREALKIMQNRLDISLVLTDINMPHMDGLTLLARLNELNRPIKTVVVSAYGDIRNIRVAMNRGAFDFVTKPINFDDLDVTIRKTRKELLAFHKATEAQHRLVALQKEFEVARRIQEAIRPLSFPERPDVELYAFMSTAQDVGGTFYDFFEVGDHQVGFLVGDVAGKGVPAALFMAMSQTFLKGIARQGEDPGVCLTSMNRLLFPVGLPDLNVTVFYGLLDTRTGKLVYTNAGHPIPYVLRKEGHVSPVDAEADLPVWDSNDHTYTTRHLELKPGEGIFLFTSGVVEAVDEHGHAFSTDRLALQLRTSQEEAPAGIIRGVVRSVMQHADDVHDDLTVMALRYLG